MSPWVLGDFNPVAMDHDLKFKKVLNFFLKFNELRSLIMKGSVEVNKLPDSFRVFFELEINVSDLAGKGLGSFKDLLGNGCN